MSEMQDHQIQESIAEVNGQCVWTHAVSKSCLVFKTHVQF